MKSREIRENRRVMSEHIAPLSSHDLADLTSEFEGSKENVMAMNAVTAAGID